MEQYIGHIFTALVMLGGLAGVYAKLQARLARIETRMEMEEKARDERLALVEMRTRDVMYRYCQNECPRRGQGGTNPRAENPLIAG